MEWKTIPGYPMHEVSDEGQVRSRHSGMLLKQHQTPDGYFFVNIRGRDNKQRRLHVHHLVALAFIGPRPDGHVVHHRDHVRSNNARDNLCYFCDFAHRSIDASERVGEKNYTAKLTNEEAAKIRVLYAEHGVKQDVLAQMFGVTQSIISRIVTGKGYTDGSNI